MADDESLQTGRPGNMVRTTMDLLPTQPSAIEFWCRFAE